MIDWIFISVTKRSSVVEDQLERLREVHDELVSLREEIRNLKDNHLHHLEIRMTKLETSLSVGWKAVIVGAGIPAIISSILSVVTMMGK